MILIVSNIYALILNLVILVYHILVSFFGFIFLAIVMLQLMIIINSNVYVICRRFTTLLLLKINQIVIIIRNLQ
jgi:hypothetical protein